MDGNKCTGLYSCFKLIFCGLHILPGSVLPGEQIPSCYGYTLGGEWQQNEVGDGHCSAAQAPSNFGVFFSNLNPAH
jgi:hypothetical protein